LCNAESEKPSEWGAREKGRVFLGRYLGGVREWRHIASEPWSQGTERRWRIGILVQLHITKMIGVRMAHEDGVHRSKPAVVPAPYRISGIKQNPHPGWIFKQKSSILSAEISGAGPERRDFHSPRLPPGKGSNHLDEG
jgi:hypothetical protein